MKKNITKFICCLVFCTITFPVFASDSHTHLNKIISKIESDQVVVGIWIQSMSPLSVMGLVESNGEHDADSAINTPMIDFALIDMEHHPYDAQSLMPLMMMFHSKKDVLLKGNMQPNLCPIVRIPTDANGPIDSYIKQVLDAGAFGVVVPHCRTAAEAEKVVMACRYPQANDSPYPLPAGLRGASPRICSYVWGLSRNDYIRHADVWPLNPDGDLLAIVMIEDVEGVNNIEEIVSVPGLGGVMFGPFDYSFSSGTPGVVNTEAVINAEKKVLSACQKQGIPFIKLARTEDAQSLVKDGYRVLLTGYDVNRAYLTEALIQNLKSGN